MPDYLSSRTSTFERIEEDASAEEQLRQAHLRIIPDKLQHMWRQLLRGALRPDNARSHTSERRTARLRQLRDHSVLIFFTLNGEPVCVGPFLPLPCNRIENG